MTNEKTYTIKSNDTNYVEDIPGFEASATAEDIMQYIWDSDEVECTYIDGQKALLLKCDLEDGTMETYTVTCNS